MSDKADMWQGSTRPALVDDIGAIARLLDLAFAPSVVESTLGARIIVGQKTDLPLGVGTEEQGDRLRMLFRRVSRKAGHWLAPLSGAVLPQWQKKGYGLPICLLFDRGSKRAGMRNFANGS